MAAKSILTSPARKAVTATVQRVGRLQKVSADDANAASADLRITLTGGTAGTQTQAEFVVALNIRVGREGTAQLTDETAGSPPVSARKSGNKYVFGPVQFTEPGPTARRVIRITNLRGNANQLGVSSTLVPTQIVANISISTPDAISLVDATQTVAVVDHTSRARAR